MMRVIKLRAPRSDIGKKRTLGTRTCKTKKSNRLYIQPPPQIGDALLATNGLTYTLMDEFAGVARMAIVKNKGVVPCVYVWAYQCESCGQAASTRKVASEKPTAKNCTNCLAAKRMKKSTFKSD